MDTLFTEKWMQNSAHYFQSWTLLVLSLSFVLGFWRRISESGEQVWAGVLKGFDLSLSGLIHLSLSHPAVALCRYLIVILEGFPPSKLICRGAEALTLIIQILQEEEPTASSISDIISL